MKQKTQVADIDRSLYDFRYDEDAADLLASGITPDIIREISEEKGDPEWMRQFRLHSLEIFAKTDEAYPDRKDTTSMAQLPSHDFFPSDIFVFTLCFPKGTPTRAAAASPVPHIRIDAAAM